MRGKWYFIFFFSNLKAVEQVEFEVKLKELKELDDAKTAKKRLKRAKKKSK